MIGKTKDDFILWDYYKYSRDNKRWSESVAKSFPMDSTMGNMS